MKLDRIFNMKAISNKNISMTTALLIFYLIYAQQFTQGLYSGQLTDFLSDNRYAQHAIGYSTMLIIVMEVGGVHYPQAALLYSALAYLWFIMTTKMDLQWSLAMIALLVFAFIYENQMEDKEEQLEKDEAVEDEDLKRIRKAHKKHRTAIGLSLLCITIIGMLMYYNKKKGQYGGHFDMDKFILGGKSY